MKSGIYTVDGVNYTVYENGDIYGPSGKKLKWQYTKDGYPCVGVGKKKTKTRTTTYRKKKTVHRIVAETLLPNPYDLSEVDHIDGDRGNPSLNNLEWVTHKENVRRAYARGSYKGRYVGEKNPKAKLKETDVIRLRNEYNAGNTITELVKKYGIPYSTVGNVVHGHTWKHLL